MLVVQKSQPKSKKVWKDATIFCFCRQLWQLSWAVASFDSNYKLSPALTALTGCGQHWQLLKVMTGFDTCYMLLAALTADTSFRQLWQRSQAVDSIDSYYNRSNELILCVNKNDFTGLCLWQQFGGAKESEASNQVDLDSHRLLCRFLVSVSFS